MRCSGVPANFPEIERARAEVAKLEEERDQALKTGSLFFLSLSERHCQFVFGGGEASAN